MSIYAIGDIHGARHLLDALLDRLAARGPIKQLWFVGDLVNRGTDSLGVLRRVRDLGERAVTVLGNHDLSLLALAQRPDAIAQAPPNLKPILCAPDGDILLDWLRRRPLMHGDRELGWTMVHAGLPPSWTIDEAMRRARELEQALRSPSYPDFLRLLFGNTPETWTPRLAGAKRLRFIANALTRIRFVTPDARLNMTYKKTIAGAPAGLLPWFQVAHRASADTRIVFGHWSALEQMAWPQHNVWGIDTGAAWGGRLTAIDLTADHPGMIQVSSEHA